MTAAELKASILELAIRGKLVAQDPNDEPVSSVLKKISPEMLELACDVPFDIPSGWAWVCHNSIINISGGAQPPKAQFVSEPREGYVRLYQIRDYGDNPVPVYIPKKTASKTTHKGDILLARYGGSLGKVFWAEEGAYNVAMAKVIVHDEYEKFIDLQFVYLYYHTDLYRKVILKNGRSAQAGFNKDDLRDMLFPLPPLAEQKRIVEMVEELMPLVDRYEKAEAKRIELEKALPGDLEKSILQEAIHGKLVEQDPNNEHVCESVDLECAPYELPNGWAWQTLGEICDIKTGKKDANYGKNGGPYPFFTCAKDPIRCPGYSFSGEAILLAGNGDLGNISYFEGDFEAYQRTYVLQANGKVQFDFRYLLIHLRANWVEYNLDKTFGSTIPYIRLGNLRDYMVALPPLAEQKLIVAKVEELLGALKRLH